MVAHCEGDTDEFQRHSREFAAALEERGLLLESIRLRDHRGLCRFKLATERKGPGIYRTLGLTVRLRCEASGTVRAALTIRVFP
jgi:hypothetical protein